MKIKVSQVATADLAASSAYPPVVVFDRRREDVNKPILIHQGTLSANNWAINSGKGERGASNRYTVPLHAYSSKNDSGTPLLTFQLAVEIVNSLQRQAESSGKPDYVGQVLIGEHGSKIYVGYCLVPPEVK